MRDADRHELIQSLGQGMTADGAGSPGEADHDVTVLVAAALLASSSDDLIVDALGLASSTQNRQFVAIAAAYLAGDHDQVDALARDHLLDHPLTPVLAWIIRPRSKP